MTDSQERRVRAESWRDDVSQALQEGYTWLYQLTAVDGIGGELGSVIEILLRLEDSAGRSIVIQTAVPRDRAELPAIDDLIAGAAWYQREVHDQFGVVFTAADMTPLLVHPQALADHHQPLGEHQSAAAAPLRKDVVLTATSTMAPAAQQPPELVVAAPAAGDVGAVRHSGCRTPRLSPSSVPGERSRPRTSSPR